jgi:hypothetical protein
VQGIKFIHYRQSDGERVIDVEEAETLVNHLLAQAEHRQFIQEEAGYV